MRKKRLTIDSDHTAFLGTLETDSMQHRTFAAFAEAAAKHAVAVARMDDPKFEGKDGRVPDKHRSEWEEVCAEAEKRGQQMFRTFDTYARTAKHTIHVPADEMRQVIYDALMTNLDAMPDYLPLNGPARGHAMRGLADNLIDAIRASQVQVVEDEQDVPYCDECMEKLS